MTGPGILLFSSESYFFILVIWNFFLLVNIVELFLATARCENSLQDSELLTHFNRIFLDIHYFLNNIMDNKEFMVDGILNIDRFPYSRQLK